jgi:uncharacterized protein YrrD
MLWNASMMNGYAVLGLDGQLGTVRDLLFDDSSWKIRWLVVNTRDWFPDHEVLLPVSVLRYPDPTRQQLGVTLTVQQIQDSPHLDDHLPVSRHVEIGPPLHHTAAGPPAGYAVLSESKPNDPHLRSMEAVIGHRVHAIDGLFGHVDDFLINDADWSVRFIKVDTRNWDSTQRALLPPRLIRKIDWPARAVHLEVDRQAIESRSLRDSAAGAAATNGEMSLACKDIRWVKE